MQFCLGPRRHIFGPWRSHSEQPIGPRNYFLGPRRDIRRARVFGPKIKSSGQAAHIVSGPFGPGIISWARAATHVAGASSARRQIFGPGRSHSERAIRPRSYFLGPRRDTCRRRVLGPKTTLRARPTEQFHRSKDLRQKSQVLCQARTGRREPKGPPLFP